MKERVRNGRPEELQTLRTLHHYMESSRKHRVLYIDTCTRPLSLFIVHGLGKNTLMAYLIFYRSYWQSIKVVARYQ